MRAPTPPSATPSASPSAPRALPRPPAPTTSASPSPAALSRDDGWRADIDLLLEARERIHPDPWHGMPRAEWVAAADAVKAAIPTLTDDQALVELVRLAAMPGWAGREGHTGIFPFIPDSGTHEYPLKFWEFGDELGDDLVITDARDPYSDVIDTRVVAIEGRPIAEVMALVEPLAPRDNPSNLMAYAPIYLRTSELLAGLGVLEEAGPATFTVADRDGVERDVVIEPVEPEDDIAWHGGEPLTLPVGKPLWLQDRDAPIWWEFLPDSGTLYVQYNVDGSGHQRDRPGDHRRAPSRTTSSGSSSTCARTVAVTTARTGRSCTASRIRPSTGPGGSSLLIGRLTFSAAANFATELDQTTGAWFAGEDMGGSPNLYGDTRRTELPTSGQVAYIAKIYWEKSTPDDPRITIEPELPVPYTFEDYLAGRDPVLDAVIEESPPGG